MDKLLLNKISVLDKGFVALISASNTTETMRDIEFTYFRAQHNKQLLKLGTATLIFKCPIFVQLFLSSTDLTVVSLPQEGSIKDVDIFVPRVHEIGTGNVNDDQDISQHLQDTTESLLTSVNGYLKDKCDKTCAQSIMPISTYNSVLVHGSLDKWIDLIKKDKLPIQVELYRRAVEDLLKAEWQKLDTYKRML